MIRNENNFHPNGTAIIFKKDDGLLESFQCVSVVLSYFPPPLHTPLSLLSISLTLESEFIDHSKGSVPLSSHRKWTIHHISRLKVYKMGAAESQPVAMKEAPQEQRNKIFSREWTT